MSERTGASAVHGAGDASRPGTGTGSSGGGGSSAVAAKAAAVALWVIVGGGLLYGVVQTGIRAAQLFG